MELEWGGGVLSLSHRRLKSVSEQTTGPGRMMREGNMYFESIEHHNMLPA